MVLVAKQPNSQSGENEILGVGRQSRSHGRDDAEGAVLIRDNSQWFGLRSELLGRLLAVANDEKFDRVFDSPL
jgi:acetyltransferase